MKQNDSSAGSRTDGLDTFPEFSEVLDLLHHMIRILEEIRTAQQVSQGSTATKMPRGHPDPATSRPAAQAPAPCNVGSASFSAVNLGSSGTAFLTHPQPSALFAQPLVASSAPAPLIGSGQHQPFRARAAPGTRPTSAVENRFYVVTRGLEVGVFRGWGQTAPLVIGVPRATFWRAPSQLIAHQQFAEAQDLDEVEIL